MADAGWGRLFSGLRFFEQYRNIRGLDSRLRGNDGIKALRMARPFETGGVGVNPLFQDVSA